MKTRLKLSVKSRRFIAYGIQILIWVGVCGLFMACSTVPNYQGGRPLEKGAFRITPAGTVSLAPLGGPSINSEEGKIDKAYSQFGLNYGYGVTDRLVLHAQSGFAQSEGIEKDFVLGFAATYQKVPTELDRWESYHLGYRYYNGSKLNQIYALKDYGGKLGDRVCYDFQHIIGLNIFDYENNSDAFPVIWAFNLGLQIKLFQNLWISPQVGAGMMSIIESGSEKGVHFGIGLELDLGKKSNVTSSPET